MASRLSQVTLDNNQIFVRACYRDLWRATYIAFKGDRKTLTASRKFARDSFRQNKNLKPGSVEAAREIEHAQGVTKILRENVVQGQLTEKGTYKLGIHEHTERGDNDTAGQLKGTSKTWKEVKNASF